MCMANKLLILITVLMLVFSSGCLTRQMGTDPISSKSLDIKDQYLIAGSPEVRASNIAVEKTLTSERKVILTADIRLEVVDARTVINDITNLTTASGGFISGSSVYDMGNRRSGNVVVRVPQKDFYSVIEQIEKLGTLRSKDIKGQDVTEEFIDLSARLGNLKKQEQRLLEILKMAASVKDVLEVEHELERVRGGIESLTGRQNYLDQSIEMSQISVTADEPAPITGDGQGIADALRQAVRGFIESVNELIIFTGYILPIMIFIIVVILVALGIKRKILPIIWK